MAKIPQHNMFLYGAAYRQFISQGHGISRVNRPEGRTAKIPQYDIFLGTFGEDASWLEAVDGVDNALTKMKFLATKAPGPYFVFCQKTQRVVASMNTKRLCESKTAKSV